MEDSPNFKDLKGFLIAYFYENFNGKKLKTYKRSSKIITTIMGDGTM
jgi:hypothetical protein